MPELPEVETIRRGLEGLIINKKIVGVEVRLKKIFFGDVKKIIGARFCRVRRFGKALILDLNNNYSIVIHPKMTGQIVYKSKGIFPSRFTHIVFTLSTGRIFYNDLRQFGWIKIVKTKEVLKIPFFRNLGPEPPVVSSIEGRVLTPEIFKNLVSRNSGKIKVLLLDQKKISGIGNIYANEALFLAGLNPTRKGSSLTNDETLRLYKAITKVLKLGLKYGGSSENTFLNARGERGNYQKYALVYGRRGETCRRCNSSLQVIQLSGRGTFFCEKCQK